MEKHIDRIPFFEYWFKMPARRIAKEMKRLIRYADRIINHKWYCIYCNEWHHRRDRKYITGFLSKVEVCYRGIEAIKNVGGNENE